MSTAQSNLKPSPVGEGGERSETDEVLQPLTSLKISPTLETEKPSFSARLIETAARGQKPLHATVFRPLVLPLPSLGSLLGTLSSLRSQFARLAITVRFRQLRRREKLDLNRKRCPRLNSNLKPSLGREVEKIAPQL